MDTATRRQTNWYVVQVTTNYEERICEKIEGVCTAYDAHEADEGKLIGLKSCFNPKFASRKKRMGKWHDVDRPLLPGYVIADARNPERLAQALRGVRDFCRLLANDETYSSLDEAEREWIEAQAGGKGRAIPLSFGYRGVGDVLVVSSGPLAGKEAMITRFDRRNCIAHVELHAGPMTFKTTVGLVLKPSGEIRNVS